MHKENPHFVRYLEILKDSPLFQGVPVEDLKELLEQMNPVHWGEKETRNSKDHADCFHIVVSGVLKVYQVNSHKGREHTLYLLTRGDGFDILSLMDGEEHDIYWECLEELEVLVVNVQRLRDWIENTPEVKHSLFCYLGERMRKLEEIASDMALHSTLVRLSQLIAHGIQKRTKFKNPVLHLSHHELASIIGTTRAVVNRHIQELKKSGAIDVHRKEIQIRDLNKLLDIAEEKITP